MDLFAVLLGTLVLRPYVFGFLLAYLLAAGTDLGWRRALLFTGWAWAVAFLAEWSSTRSGIPFGLYHYTGLTRGQELFLANVPLFDSLSFTFLAYAAFALARWVLGRSSGLAVVGLSGAMMTLLDVVIDPLAVRGDRWFLGPLFYYPEGGVYFGVPLSNFLGWAIVGWVIIGGYLVMSGGPAWDRPGRGAGLYYVILAFNLALTAWIGELLLLGLGLLLHAAAFLALWRLGSVRMAPALIVASSARFARANFPSRSARTAGTGGFRSPRPLGPQPQAGLRPARRPRDVLRLALHPGGRFGRAKPPSESSS